MKTRGWVRGGENLTVYRIPCRSFLVGLLWHAAEQPGQRDCTSDHDGQLLDAHDHGHGQCIRDAQSGGRREQGQEDGIPPDLGAGKGKHHDYRGGGGGIGGGQGISWDDPLLIEASFFTFIEKA